MDLDDASTPRPSGDSTQLDRRLGLRVLLGTTVAAVTYAATGGDSTASAAPTSTAWVLGGNSISTDGSNFLGTTNAAPIIFKTRATSGSSVTEKARLTPGGLLGIGTTAPVGRLHVISGLPSAIRGDSPSTDRTAAAIWGQITSTSSSNSSAGVSGTNAGPGAGVQGTSKGGYGVLGTSTYAGVKGTGTSYGMIATASSDTSVGINAVGGKNGVQGTGTQIGVQGSSTGGDVATCFGVQGTGPVGVQGTGTGGGSGGIGVIGTGTTGVKSVTSNGTGFEAEGASVGLSTTGGAFGVHAMEATSYAVFGESAYVGLWGDSQKYGVVARTVGNTAESIALYCIAPSGFKAIDAHGNVAIAGTLSKTAGSFKIDHPLDPDHKYLSHSFVESPDMMNVYNGNVVLGPDGSAVVELPEWFEALNQDFRYQLTPIGAPASLYVKRKIEGNAFEIAGGPAGLEVSWQVTGIRHDEYARKHRIPVEEAKPADEAGTRISSGTPGQQLDRSPVATRS